MPVINIKMSSTTDEKKKELIQKLTETASEVTNISKGAFTVFIEEYPHQSIGVGGEVLSDIMAKQ